MGTHLTRTSKWIITAFAVIVIPGCATLFSSTSQTVRFESNPSNVEVFINGESVGQTPIDVEIDKSTFDNYQLRFQKEGYKTLQKPLTKGLNKTALFNLTGMSSWATDAISGAMIQFTPDNYYIELSPQVTSLKDQSKSEGRLFIIANQQKIKEEIAKGHGEHLSAIALYYKLTETEKHAYNKALKVIGPAIITEKQPLAFIDLVEPK